MKAYKGCFKKKNGESRTMVFSRIDDLPTSFVASKIAGAGSEQRYPKGMELVWDVENSAYRMFNYKTVVGKVEEVEVNLTQTQKQGV